MLLLRLPSLAWAPLLCLLVLLVGSGNAIYQDEAYKTDFAHQLVGVPIRANTFFHRPSNESKATLLYTLSEQNVIGAINPRDGELVWRVLADDTVQSGSQRQRDGVLRTYETSPFLFSGIGNTVRAWDANNGRLVWEWTSSQAVRSLEVVGTEHASGDVFVVTEGAVSGGTVVRLSKTDGAEKWALQLAKTDYPLGVSVSASQIFCTSLSPASRGGYKIKVQTLDYTNGKQLAHVVLDTEGDVSSEESIIHLSAVATAPIIAWGDDKMKNVKFNVLGNKHISISMVNPYGTAVFKSVLVHESKDIGANPHFLIQYTKAETHQGEVWHIDTKSGKIARAFESEQAQGLGAFSARNNGQDVYFTRHTEEKTTLIASTSPDVIESWPLTQTKGSAYFNRGAAFAISELAPRAGKSFSVRNAYISVDGDLIMTQNGAQAWSRYEGLAGVVAAAFVEIPAEESLVQVLAAETNANPVSAYLHRLQRHAADLQHLPGWLIHLPARIVSSFTGVTIGETAGPLMHDAFGFNKIVLVATERGRIAALGSTAQGQVFWSVQAVEPQKGSAWHIKSIDITPSGANFIGLAGEFIILDPMTGQISKHQEPKPESGLSHYVSVPTVSGHSSLISINNKGTPGSLPDQAPTDAVIVTERPDGSIAGWKHIGNGKSSLAWSFVPKEGESITSLVTRPSHDPVASIGRALGDRNVLYKYLSNNLILVTATSLAASTLSVYLLDSITGQTIYSTSHSNVDVSNEIPVVFAENWFAYSLFSNAPSVVPVGGSDNVASTKAHQLVVSEMFESSMSNDRGPLGQALNYSSLDNLFSPEVRSTAFVVATPLTTLATTSTLQGITPRSLLAYSPALAAMIAIPVPFLSPRRPVNRDPTPGEREEGLFRYQPHLDLPPTWLLSHQREVIGIEGIIAAPSQMESTSVIFAFGKLDIFGTRVAPIGTFDVLGNGFGKVQLILTCLALSIGTGFLSPMARRKQIDGLWRS